MIDNGNVKVSTQNQLMFYNQPVGTVKSIKHKNAPITNSDPFIFTPYTSNGRSGMIAKEAHAHTIDVPLYVSQNGKNKINPDAVYAVFSVIVGLIGT